MANTTLPAPSAHTDLDHLTLAALYCLVGTQLAPLLAPDAVLPRLFAQPAAPAGRGDNDDSESKVHDGDVNDDTLRETHDGGVNDDTLRETHDGDVNDDTLRETHDGDVNDDTLLETHDGDVNDDTLLETHDGDVNDDTLLETHDGDVNDDTLLETHDGNVKDDTLADAHDGNSSDPLFHPAFLDYLHAITVTFTATQLLPLIRAEIRGRFWLSYPDHLTPSMVGRVLTRLGLSRSRTMSARTFTLTLPKLARLLAAHPLALQPGLHSDRLASVLRALHQQPPPSPRQFF